MPNEVNSRLHRKRVWIGRYAADSRRMRRKPSTGTSKTRSSQPNRPLGLRPAQGCNRPFPRAAPQLDRQGCTLRPNFKASST